MVEAIYALKGLLAKWLAATAILIFLSANTVYGFIVPGPGTSETSADRSLGTSADKRSKAKQAIAANQSKLPPFKSELDELPADKPLATADSGGNSYARGNCTWYAKSKRPDLPNSLGDANTWVSRAKASGLQTGIEPIEGAIGQQGRHVVYVEQVNDDGTVTISEMNYEGLGVISKRTLPASSFRYIY